MAPWLASWIYPSKKVIGEHYPLYMAPANGKRRNSEITGPLEGMDNVGNNKDGRRI